MNNCTGKRRLQSINTRKTREDKEGVIAHLAGSNNRVLQTLYATTAERPDWRNTPLIHSGVTKSGRATLSTTGSTPPVNP